MPSEWNECGYVLPLIGALLCVWGHVCHGFKSTWVSPLVVSVWIGGFILSAPSHSEQCTAQHLRGLIRDLWRHKSAYFLFPSLHLSCLPLSDSWQSLCVYHMHEGLATHLKRKREDKQKSIWVLSLWRSEKQKHTNHIQKPQQMNQGFLTPKRAIE